MNKERNRRVDKNGSPIKRTRRLFALVIIMFFFSCVSDSNEGDSGKIIEISTIEFGSDYPAVFFSLIDGSFLPVSRSEQDTVIIVPDVGSLTGFREKTIQLPPEDKFQCWVEPSDPEFNCETVGYGGISSKVEGVKYFGGGLEAFNKIQKKTDTYNYSDMGPEYFTTNTFENVFLDNLICYFIGTNFDALVMFLEADKINQKIRIRWKKIL